MSERELMKIYLIILTNGKNIECLATDVEWDYKTRHIRLFCNNKVVSRFNMDNIVGWIEKKYAADKENKE